MQTIRAAGRGRPTISYCECDTHWGQPPGTARPCFYPGALCRPAASQQGHAGDVRRYKAFFRWPHYPTYLRDAGLPSETDACASVTSAFLQVLQTLHTAEHMRSSGTAHPRSVLQVGEGFDRQTQ